MKCSVSFLYIQLCKYPGTAEGCLSWVQSRSVPPLSCGLSLWSTDGRSAGEPHPLLSGPPRIHLNHTQTQKQMTGLGMKKEFIWKKLTSLYSTIALAIGLYLL